MSFPNARAPRIDWPTARESIDLAAVATSLLGPPPGRRGERGLWWACPFHEDRNPSLKVDPDKGRWRCFGCGASGDAAALVMRLQGLTFPEAVRRLAGDAGPVAPGKAARGPAKPPPAPAPAGPTGLPEADALALVGASEARLWGPEGSDALAYLTGPRRLPHESIRSARLGWVDGVSIPTRDGGRAFLASGWVIPWFDDAGRLALVKVRQPDGRRPKYVEAYRHPGRLTCYPSPESIRPGRPLIVVEGELDALCLGAALGDRAGVVTLGGASSSLPAAVRARAALAPSWYAAHDNDPAGDRAAASWPARARRVRPPAPHKDWTEARAAGVDLRRWWGDVFRGAKEPDLRSWDDLSAWRWDGADEAPGIDNPGRRPAPGTLAMILDTTNDPEARAEREAIAWEARGCTDR